MSTDTLSDDKIKVLLVDDSAVIRGLLARALRADPAIDVIGSAQNGQMAVSMLKRADPDVIVLDIEMPVMDGITALPLLLREKPGVKIIVCSTLSRKGAAVSVKALSLGAADCLVKPTSTDEIGGSAAFKDALLRLVKTFGAVRKAAHVRNAAPAPLTLRPENTAYQGKPALIAIGSSTGGPKALFRVLEGMAGIDIPIVITQHMPKTFTALLAEHIHHNCGLPCHEGADGMALEGGHAYVAPGGYHMTFARKGVRTEIVLDDGPPEHYCKPSVEPMMRSLVPLYGNRVLGVMLTGMGHDGLEGFRLLAGRGGKIIAQDEASSVVWGMPGAVAAAGLCTRILPLDEIGPHIRNLL